MRKRYAYLLLLPSVLILALTVFIPIITTFRYSLKRYSLTDPGSEKYIGLKNYQKILLDPAFHNALLKSFIILVIVVVFGLMLSVAIA